MRQFTSLMTRVLLVAALLLPGAAVQAVEKFDEAGYITAISFDKFTVNGREYRIAPGARLDSDDSSRRRLSDFKKGDEIYFKGTIVNDVYYVDIIFYESPVPS